MTAGGQPPSLYLLDTNILLAYIRDSALSMWIEAVHGLLTLRLIPGYSIVSEGELRVLALRLNWGAARLRRLEHLLTTFTRISLDVSGVIDAYATIDAYTVRAGRPMGKNDVWIAATANAIGATLLTTDRDFDHLDPIFVTRILVQPA